MCAPWGPVGLRTGPGPATGRLCRMGTGQTRNGPPAPGAPVAVVALVGPTAAGKTGLSLDLAEALGGEVVNTDAMQVYRGMDIGTAKLPSASGAACRHHLLDLLDVTEQRHRRGVPEAGARGRRGLPRARRHPGAGRRLGALHPRRAGPLRVPRHRPGVRARLEAELAAAGSGGDARPAGRGRPRGRGPDPAGNGRRVVRALEVVELTGRPFSARLPEQAYFHDDTVQVGVDIPRPVLDERIERPGGADVGGRPGRGGPTAGRRRPAGGPHGGPGAGLPAGARVPRRRAVRGRGVRADRRRAPGASPGGRTAWFRKDPRITWVGWDDPDRAAEALRVVRAVESGGAG